MAFYAGKKGLTRALQQDRGDLEFRRVDALHINGKPRSVYEVRRYTGSGWEFAGRIDIGGGPHVMQRAYNMFEMGVEWAD